MRAMDEILHPKYPFYGSREVQDELRDRGFKFSGDAWARNARSKSVGKEKLQCRPSCSESVGKVCRRFSLKFDDNIDIFLYPVTTLLEFGRNG